MPSPLNRRLFVLASMGAAAISTKVDGGERSRRRRKISMGTSSGLSDSIPDLSALLDSYVKRIPAPGNNKTLFDASSIKLPHGRKIVVLQPDEEGRAPLVIEPFTWGWLGLKLVEGAIAYVGSKALERLLGDNVDFVSIQRKSIAELSNLVRRALADQELQNVTAIVTAVQRYAQEYFNAPSPDRLNDWTRDSNELVARLEALKLPAGSAYVVAVGLHIAALQERAIRMDSPGEKKNIISTCQYARSHIQFLRDESWRVIAGRFSGVLANPDIGLWYTYEDGENGGIIKLGHGISVDDARKTIADHTAREWVRVMGPFADQVWQISEKLQELIVASS